MARLPRLFVSGYPQHVIQRGSNRQNIFHDESDYQGFAALLADAIQHQGIALHAYVLMPNHLHLLATAPNEKSIGLAMQAIGRRYVQAFNQKNQRSGPLWEGRYRSTIIDSEHYLLFCSQYIELNPVRSGLVSAPEQYPWSSCAHHVGKATQGMLTDHALYWGLGNTPFERQAAYRQRLEQEQRPDQIKALRDATNKAWALGSEAFMAQLQDKANRRPVPTLKGRPRHDGTPNNS